MKKRIIIDLIVITLFFLAVLAITWIRTDAKLSRLEQENEERWCMLEELAIEKLQMGDLIFLMKQRIKEIDYIKKFNEWALPEGVESEENK